MILCCLKTYSKASEPVHFLSISGLAWQARLKKTEGFNRFTSRCEYVTNARKSHEVESVKRYAKANNKYMKVTNPSKITNPSTESSNLKY